MSYQRDFRPRSLKQSRAKVAIARQDDALERKLNPRDHYLSHKYGLTQDQYNEMLAEQDFRCKICGESDEELQVDHCHEGGQIRGLLCGKCNRGLGFFRDDPDLLAKAIEYVEQTS